MKLYPVVFFNVLRTSTVVALLSISSVSAFAMNQMDENEKPVPMKKGYISANYKPVPFVLNPSSAVAAIERDSAGNPKRITADNNKDASYQLESNRFSAKPGDVIKIPYKIRVERSGKISFGLLNSAKDGWNGEELVLKEGTHQGTFERTVPAGESETSVVFRNYHLTEPGQSAFTIEHLDIQKKEAFWLNSTGISASVVQKTKGGPITVITDNNNHASYQLVSDRFSVEPNDPINIHYKITVQPNGIMSIGCLNTAENDWYGEELVLKEGTYEGTYIRTVPAKESETSVVFRNYHLGKPGQSTFTIEHLDIQKKGLNYFSTLPDDLVQVIFQSCSIQEALNFSATQQRLKNLCDSHPFLWASFMEQHNDALPKLERSTKLNVMSHALVHRHYPFLFDESKYYRLILPTYANRGGTCYSIQVKNLLKLFEMFPLGPDNQSFFNIGKDTFRLSWTASVLLSMHDGPHSRTCCSTKEHNMERFPEAWLDVAYYGENSFVIFAIIKKKDYSPFSYWIFPNWEHTKALSDCKTPEECPERNIKITIKKIVPINPSYRPYTSSEQTWW